MRFYAGFVHQAVHGDGFADVPKAGRLSASERPGGGVAKLGSIARILFILDWLPTMMNSFWLAMPAAACTMCSSSCRFIAAENIQAFLLT